MYDIVLFWYDNDGQSGRFVEACPGLSAFPGGFGGVPGSWWLGGLIYWTVGARVALIRELLDW